MPDAHSSLAAVEPEVLVATASSSGEILFRNEAWTHALGSSTSLWTNLLEEDKDIASQNFKEAAGGSLVTNAVFMLKRPDRDLPVPILLHFIPISSSSEDSSSRSRLVVLTGEILSEPESWTENQTDKHRMETLGRMTMGIAHDFNNLLSGILGHIALAQSNGSITDALSDHLNTIEQAANDGAALVNKIQRYIRQEKQASFVPLALNNLIEDCITLTKPYWYNEPRRQGVSIELHFESVELPHILGSAAELRDVFVNLILNAVQALPTGGVISISAESLNGNVQISVNDTGTGMEPEILSRIFEPLFTTKGGRGSGMGLAVAFGVVQEHDGSIDAASDVGKGTTFKLSLPIYTGTSDTSPDRYVEHVGGPMSVLVVDDEEMVRTVIERLLTLRGHDIKSVASAKDALSALESGTFDVVLSDQGMPEMSGRELARKIRVLYPSLPVVLLTGDTDLNVDPRDIDRVVPKPFQADDLENAILAVARKTAA